MKFYPIWKTGKKQILQRKLNMEKIRTEIPFNYITVKTTKSRIDKGLLSIPVSLTGHFPEHYTKISLIDENNNEEIIPFTPYKSSSKECRIGGLKRFYDKFKVSDGDELVIQFLDNNKIRLLPELYFQTNILQSLNTIENSLDEKEIDSNLDFVSKISNVEKDVILKNEFIRLSSKQMTERKTRMIKQVRYKDTVPLSLRKILLSLYEGKCQISNFTFVMKNGMPYFEIHHIDASKGDHLKNLLVVSPNVHAQFTYANLEQKFDSDGWLREVKFNDRFFAVNQIIDKLPKYFEKEVHL